MAAAGNGRQGPSLPAIGEGPTGAVAPPGGYPCPACGSRTAVTDSRSGPLGWRRRRRCMSCGFRFTTIETLYSRDLEAAIDFRRRLLPKLQELVRLATSLADEDEGDDLD